MSDSYVPGKQKEYNKWQLLVVATVQANATNWNIDTDELAILTANSNAYKPLYTAIEYKNLRTPKQVYAHDTYKKTYTKYLRGFVQGHLVNNSRITPDELMGMGLNPHLYIRRAKPEINDKPIIVPSNVGGGRVRFRCTTPGLDTRGRHPDSHGIEIYYSLDPVGKNENPVDPNGDTTGKVLAADSNIAFASNIFKPRAIFTHEFGINSVGKVLRIYGRWVNTSKPQNNGPCCGITSMVIS